MKKRRGQKLVLSDTLMGSILNNFKTDLNEYEATQHV